ncbi:type II toxin-antitoxin system RelE/ParE family toxin [candidate division WOR-3 bacterium]|nr:type II toxin-antitoxin system RelE/ParE family toxin [candidate division WOR-3 bacterium]
MAYKVIIHEDARKELQKLAPEVAGRITKKIRRHLIKAPADLGVPLRGEFAGLYRYRVGDWRVIYSIAFEQETIIILRVEHRRTVYRNK